MLILAVSFASVFWRHRAVVAMEVLHPPPLRREGYSSFPSHRRDGLLDTRHIFTLDSLRVPTVGRIVLPLFLSPLR